MRLRNHLAICCTASSSTGHELGQHIVKWRSEWRLICCKVGFCSPCVSENYFSAAVSRLPRVMTAPDEFERRKSSASRQVTCSHLSDLLRSTSSRLQASKELCLQRSNPKRGRHVTQCRASISAFFIIFLLFAAVSRRRRVRVAEIYVENWRASNFT